MSDTLKQGNVRLVAGPNGLYVVLSDSFSQGEEEQCVFFLSTRSNDGNSGVCQDPFSLIWKRLLKEVKEEDVLELDGGILGKALLEVVKQAKKHGKV